MRQITEKAHAKINLGLDVLGRRADGYHLVRMIMQTIGLHDDLVLEQTGDGAEEDFSVTLETDSSEIPAGSDNLLCRAMDRMASVCGLRGHYHVRLTKRIPVAAGMAGGSTDAAAACRALRTLSGAQVTDEQLQAMLLPLGADIPYCVTGGTQLSEGIGEVLTPLPEPPACALVIVKPPVAVSTAQVYRDLDSLPDYRHPDIDGQIEALRSGDLCRLAGLCDNVLELVTGEAYPMIGALEKFFTERGALVSRMSGSGPTVFAIFAEEDREKAAAALQEMETDARFTDCRGFLTSFSSGRSREE